MKKMKRILGVALVCCLAPGLLPLSVLAFYGYTEIAYAVEGGNIYFYVEEGTIIDCDDSVTAADIPSEINGVSVTNIDTYAFNGCSKLTKITVDSSNPNYISVDGVLFDKNCENLIQYPSGKQGTSYVIPDGVTTIAECAFDKCSELASITIPSSVTSINDNAIWCCRRLTDIIVDSGNSKYKSVDGVLFDKNCENLMLYPAGRAGTSYVIPDGVTSIREHAFYLCFGMTAIAIPDSVTSIGEEVFWDCREMKDVYYSGSQAEWDKISIEDGNENLTNATIHYNSSGTEIMIPTPTSDPEPEPFSLPEPEKPEQAPMSEPPVESFIPAAADDARHVTAGAGHLWVYVAVGALLMLGVVVLLKAAVHTRRNKKK